MKLQQLLIRQADNVEEVFNILSTTHSPETVLSYEKFRDFYDILLTKEKIEYDESFEINISLVEEEGEKWYDTCAIKLDTGELCGLSLTDWDEWISMTVHEKTMANFSEPEIIACCIWELTWYGSEDDMKKTRGEIEEKLQRIENGDTEGIISMPIEEFLDRMENNDWEDIITDDDEEDDDET